MKKLILIWLAFGIFNIGVFNANFRGDYPNLCRGGSSWARENLGTATIAGLITGPLGTLVYVPMSGFMYHGWTLSGAPCK